MSNQLPPSAADIAVIGMACHFPGANTPEDFWKNLRQGIESIRLLSDEELRAAGVTDETLTDPQYVKAAAVLDNLEWFDPAFFGLSPKEGAIMDPQHRHFLECAWEALETAGHTSDAFAGTVGVFASCGMNAYFMYNLLRNPELVRTDGLFLLRHTGNDKDFLATRVSYVMNLTGPSVNVQTACSSSLVAVHMACQHLLSGECDMALAGGVTIELPHGHGYRYEPGEILSPDGHCRAFDAASQGTVFGSGAGVVVLRRLADAIADGDTIHAVIKGSAVNNDGSSKVGYLAPSVDGQAKSVLEALSVAGVDADTISYVEAHGTGTPVGDPIEIAALTQAFRAHTSESGFCRIGSVKTNIGHLDTAAGVASFIKVVEALKHRELPPSLHFENPNPIANFEQTPFLVNDSLTPWTPERGPRRAGVSSLGVGGTNCHVIVEEAPAFPNSASVDVPQLLVLSARSPHALDQTRARLAARFASDSPPDLADAAYTLQVGRKTFPYRWSAACRDAADAIQQLGRPMASPHRAGSRVPSVTFLFPGGGVQYPGMGRGLYDAEPVFRDVVDRGLAVLREEHGVDLRPLMFPAAGAEADAARTLAQSTHSILSIFLIEYALSQLWMSWGVTPSAMSGHSLGEYTAACLAGVFSFEDALRIVKARGDVFEKLPPGAMLSVLARETDVSPYITGRLSIAAVNAPSVSVVSGPVEEIDALERGLAAHGIETQRLHIAVAAHSALLDPFLPEFERAVAAVPRSAPTIPFISNLTGQWISPDEATDPKYWAAHLRRTVRFSDGLATVLSNTDQVLLEVGPGRALTSLARQQAAQPLDVLTSLRHPSEDTPDRITMLGALGRLWSAGVVPDWSAIQKDLRRRRIALPTYPFERQRHWIDATAQPALGAAAGTGTSVQRANDLGDWFYVPVWKPVPVPEAREIPLAGDVLVFADDVGLAEGAVERARSGAVSVGSPESEPRTYVVRRGAAFANDGNRRFVVRAESQEDHDSLLREIGDGVATIAVIVHAWAVEPDGATPPVDEALGRTFFSPLALLQAIGRLELPQTLRWLFLTSGALDVSGETRSIPFAATALGPALVAPREFPSHVQLIDVVPPATARERTRLQQALAVELRTEGVGTIAYRGATRWVETVDSCRLSKPSHTPFRERGTYVITGGLGALGLELAAYLARTVHARLVLISRSPFPNRNEWQTTLGDPGADPVTRERIRRILDCESVGGSVLVATADVCEAAQLNDARARAHAAFGSVHGVFHLAGTLNDGPIQLKMADEAREVLRPKVHGTIAIDNAFADDDLDFLVLFSSVSGLLGLQGQVDYTAANAFMDAYAAFATNAGRPVVSIAWSAWKDHGLAVEASHARGRTSALVATPHPWLTSMRRSGATTVFSVEMSQSRDWVLSEHMVGSSEAVLPGTAYLELMRAAFSAIGGHSPVEFSDVVFETPFTVGQGQERTLHVDLRTDEGGYQATFRSTSGTHVTATLRPLPDGGRPYVDVAGIRRRCTTEGRTQNGYLDQELIRFGARWRAIQRVSYGKREALLELALPPEFTADLASISLHPALMDVATSGAQMLMEGFSPSTDFYVPFSYERIRVFQDVPPVVVSHVRLRPESFPGTAIFDISLADANGECLVEVTGYCMRKISSRLALVQTLPYAGDVEPDTPMPSVAALAAEMLDQGISSPEGMAALERVVYGHPVRRVVVAPVTVDGWRSRVEASAAAAALRQPHSTNTASVVPSTIVGDVERQLAALWMDLLGVAPRRPDDNFFEMGGHSLLAVRLLTRVEKTFGRRLSLQFLFQAGTIADMSAALKRREEADDEGPALVAVPREQLRVQQSSVRKGRNREFGVR